MLVDDDVVDVLTTVTVLTDGEADEDEDTDNDCEDEEEEVDDEDDVLVTLAIDAGRMYERAVILKTAPGNSKELGAVGQSAIFCELYAHMKSG